MSSNIRVNRICQYCQNEFEAKTTVTKYCSEKCGKAAYKAIKRREKMIASEVETKQVREKPLQDLKNKEILTVRQAASLLNCSAKTIYNLIGSGRIKAINLAERKTLIMRAQIDMLFESVVPEFDLRPTIKEKKVKIADAYHMAEIQLKYGISEKALYDLIKRNNIPKLAKGWHVYVPKDEIDRILGPIKI